MRRRSTDSLLPAIPALFSVVLLALPVAAQPAAGSRSGRETFSFRPRHLPADEVVEILVPLFPGVHFNQDACTGVVTTDITPNRLEPLQQVLDLLDVPRDAVDLMIRLVWADKSTIRSPVPEDLKPVADQLRERFSYTRYEVGDSFFLPSLERGRGKVEACPGYTLEYSVDRVEPASGEIDIRLDLSRVSITGDRIASILRTSQRLRPDRPSVVGAIRIAPQRLAFREGDATRYEKTADRSMILVIEASLPEPPTRSASLIDREQD